MDKNSYLLVVSSQNRESGAPGAFVAKCDRQRDISHVQLVDVHIPAIFYNVTSTKNQFDIGGTTYTVSPGAYTASGLVTALNAATPVLLAGVAFSYNSATNRFSVVRNPGAPTTYNFGISNSIGTVIGFGTAFDNLTTTPSVAPNEPKLSPSMIGISIKEIERGELVRTAFESDSNICFVFPNNASIGEYIALEEPYHDQIAPVKHGAIVHFLTVALYDLENNVALSGYTENWRFTLRVFHR